MHSPMALSVRPDTRPSMSEPRSARECRVCLGPVHPRDQINPHWRHHSKQERLARIEWAERMRYALEAIRR